jgi:recombination protein RecA
VNQTRKKIGVMFGSDTTTFGGRAVAYYSSVRIELTKSTPIKEGKKVIGMENTARTVKNKLVAPFKTVILPIFFGQGIDDALASFEFLNTGGYFKRSGSWYEFRGQKFQKKGWDKVFDEKFEEIEELILDEYYPTD